MDQLAADGVVSGAVRAVRELEESGCFNAGLGSALTTDGLVEMDAAVMRGADLAAGAVGAIRRIRSPVDLAYEIMKRTEHVLLVAEGAERAAEAFGLDTQPFPVDEARRAKLQRLLSPPSGPDNAGSGHGATTSEERSQRVRKLLERYGELGATPVTGDTVGAVAVDDHGRTAAAVSTGGIWLKLPGRVGDSPVPGAGLLADDQSGAICATGIGEVILKLSLSQQAGARLLRGQSVLQCCQGAIDHASQRMGEDTVGIIAMDPTGQAGFALNTAGMPRGLLRSGDARVRIAIARDDAFDLQ
jgi:beta-aspartyl-peptidase (threonine type)